MLRHEGERAGNKSFLGFMATCLDIAEALFPTAEAKLLKAEYLAEELKHAIMFHRIAVGLQHDFALRDVPYAHYAFHLPRETWADDAYFHFFVDLNGAFHARDWRESSYVPLAKMSATVERDELGHSEMGYHFLGEIVSEGRGASWPGACSSNGIRRRSTCSGAPTLATPRSSSSGGSRASTTPRSGRPTRATSIVSSWRSGSSRPTSAPTAAFSSLRARRRPASRRLAAPEPEAEVRDADPEARRPGDVGYPGAEVGVAPPGDGPGHERDPAGQHLARRVQGFGRHVHVNRVHAGVVVHPARQVDPIGRG